MIIVDTPEAINLTENLVAILRKECQGVECCSQGEDSGWTSNPESDMTS